MGDEKLKSTTHLRFHGVSATSFDCMVHGGGIGDHNGRLILNSHKRDTGLLCIVIIWTWWGILLKVYC